MGGGSRSKLPTYALCKPFLTNVQVSGTPVFPATGMLIMAIEAVKQVAPKDRSITAYYIKEAVFSSPIILRPGPEGDQMIESVLNLRPIHKAYEKESVWSEVWISTHHKGVWTECFRATIQTQYEETRTQVDGGTEQELVQQAAVKAYEYADKACTTPIHPDDFYKYCNKRGLSYGKSFTILEDIRWDGGDITIGYVDVNSPTSQYEGLVHPAVLDAAAQIFWTAPSKGLSDTLPTEVPHRIRDAWISASGWKSPQTSRVRVLTTSRYKPAGKGLEGTITALADDGTLLAEVRKMELSPIADDDSREVDSKKLLYNIQWKPCLSTLSSSQLRAICHADTFTDDETDMIQYCDRLDTAIFQAGNLTLASLSDTDRQLAPPHLQKYISWLEFNQSRTAGSHAHREIEKYAFGQLMSDIVNIKPEWKMFAAVARNLPEIIQGKVDPLALLFSDDLVERFYADIFTQLCDTEQFRTLMDLVSHQNSELKVLEVGAGTGGFTSHVLSALQFFEDQNGGSRFSEYVYTDISHAFFENAKSKFQRVASRMDFKVLDLEKDIATQGIEVGSYDVVIAGSVLHATANLSATLKNVRKALKSGGKLIFFELTNSAAFATFGFGILPGWWQSTEEWRTQGPAANEQQWDILLKETQFSGNDLVLRDYQNSACHSFSVIVSTAERIAQEKSQNRRIFFVTTENSEEQVIIAETIRQDQMNPNDYNSEILSLTQLNDTHFTAEDVIIFLVEFGESMFKTLSETSFKSLQKIMRDVRNVLWVASTDIQGAEYSYFGMAYGFLRTMRSEASNRRIVTLGLEGLGKDISSCAEKIRDVFTQCFELDCPEVEYIVRDGQMLTGRLVEEMAMNENLISAIHPQLKMEPWGQGPPLMFTVGTRGTLDTLQFVEDNVFQQELGENEVEIEAVAWGLNFREVFIALGRLEEDDFGFDCAGHVTRVGAGCTSVAPGDRVCMATIGCMRMFPRGDELEVIKIPDSLSFEDVVAFTAPALTTYHSLVDIARLQRGEKILVHSAAGATGQLAVSLAQMIGAEVFATVSMDEKKQMLMDTYGIPADHIFYSRNTSFAQGVMRITNGYGVDVVLNSLSGDGLRASWECIAPYGRFIEIGKVDIKSNACLPMSSFAKNVTFAAVDMHHALTRKTTTQRLLNSTMQLLGKGLIHPPRPVNIYPVSAIEDAFRFLQSGKNTGRIVITNNPLDIVPVSLPIYQSVYH